MPALEDRPARKTETDRASARRPRLRSHRLRLAISLASLVLLGLSAAPAQATTGGASALSGVAAGIPEAPAPEGAELAFGPSRFAGASWYGPGLYGRSTACGETLRATTIGVAHRSLPCGTMVRFAYHGHTVIAPVIDRGPYVKGRAWDLTKAASEALELEGVGRVQYSVALTYTRQAPTR